MPSPRTMAIGFTLPCADHEKMVWRLVREMISSAVMGAVVVSVMDMETSYDSVREIARGTRRQHETNGLALAGGNFTPRVDAGARVHFRRLWLVQRRCTRDPASTRGIN